MVKKPRTHNINISTDRHSVMYLSDPQHREWITRVGKAISSPVRLEILDILKNTPRSIQEISALLNIPLSSTSLNIKVLEEAGLVKTENQSGLHGTMKVCVCCTSTFRLILYSSDENTANKTVSTEMPVGNYFDFDIRPSCGLADEKGEIGSFDSVYSFYSPRRMKAQLVWFSGGYIEYRFQNLVNTRLKLRAISFSMELCSEAPGFNEDYPSDVTVSVNGKEVATYRCPGDMGARRGRLTPESWPNGSTQYGLLKTFSVSRSGSHVDGQLVGTSVRLDDLRLMDRPYISLKITVKEDAECRGGVNIFGRKFGDYPQGIIMQLLYE